MNEPKSFTAGDTVTWTESLSDYKASDGWTLKYRLSGPAQIDLVSTPDGDDHAISITAAGSAVYGAGVYKFQAYVEKGTERHTILLGSLEIFQNLTALEGGAEYDARSHVRIVFDALKAAIEGRATKAQSEVVINNRSITYLSPAELRIEYVKYKKFVEEEERAAQIAKGLDAGGNIVVRFRPTT